LLVTIGGVSAASPANRGATLVARASVCLDFANTLHWHASASPRETLHEYDEVLAWAAARDVIAREQAEALARRARREPRPAAEVYRRAIALREAIYRVFVARLSGAAPTRGDVAVLNQELQQSLPHYRVEFGKDGALWRSSAVELDLPLWPIVQSAVELLLSEDLRGRVGQCADTGGCGWLFLDLSKNRSRRWCSIADCGNRAKQRRLQQRLKQT
jgi:predicted RNA-binding Zn ribbon-like protein